jgi:hypothetical protein
MRYGTDDPTLWPQQWTSRYCHLPLIPKKGSRPELDIMWWNPTPTDFAVGSAVTRGLGHLKRTEFSKLIAPVSVAATQKVESRLTKSTSNKVRLDSTRLCPSESLEVDSSRLKSMESEFFRCVFLRPLAT